jgi:O-succinylbenzoic acid--CoA ligase
MAALSDWPWRHWAKQQPDEPALINQGATFSWLQLARQIDQLATGLMQQGVRSGCGVVLKARNSQPALLAYLALLQCGARVIPLNPQFPATQLAVILPTLILPCRWTVNLWRTWSHCGGSLPTGRHGINGTIGRSPRSP